MIEMHIETEVLEGWYNQLHHWHGHNWTHSDLKLAYLAILEEVKTDAVNWHNTTGSDEEAEAYIKNHLEEHHNWCWNADADGVPSRKHLDTEDREELQKVLCQMCEEGIIEEPVITDDCFWGRQAAKHGNTWG